MTLKNRRSIAVLIIAVLGICLFGSGIVAAQSNGPAPTPAPNGPSPAGPSAGSVTDDSLMVQPPGGGAPQTRAGDKDDGRVIANGKKMNGKINPATDYDWYYFYGTWNNSATIQVTRKGTVLDPVLYLYAPDGSYLAYDDDSGGNRNPLISNFWLNQAGMYSIGIASYGSHTSGNYSVTVNLTGTDKDDLKVLTSGKAVNGKISPNGDLDSFFFQGTGGQRATISMARKGGSLDSYLYLYDPNGNLITVNDDGGTGTDALINDYSLPQTGLYYLVAASYNGNSGGNYKLRLDLSRPNLALNKPSMAWSWHAPWYLPENGNDGDLNTRWSGDYGTNWYWVDLGSRMTFNQVKINWEAAYATTYFVGWSDAPDCMGTYTGSNYTANNIGYKTHNLGKRTARCVAIRMDTALSWATNYSFWEFEVYNLAASNAASPPGSVPSDAVLVDVVPEADFSDEALIQVDMMSPTQ